MCLKSLANSGHTSWHRFSGALTAGEVLGRNFVGDEQTEAELLRHVNADPLSPGLMAAISDGWATRPLMDALKANLQQGVGLPVPIHFKLATAVSPPEIFVEALSRGAK